MLDEEHLTEALRDELKGLVNGLSPRSDPLAQVEVYLSRRLVRRKASAVALIAVISGAIVLSVGAGPARLSELRLASYTFRLPAGSQIAGSATGACAVPAAVTYRTLRDQPTSHPRDSRIASAITAKGGCVSMLLTAPYRPRSREVPVVPGFGRLLSQRRVQVGSHSGALDAYALYANLIFNGVEVRSGTKHLVLTVHLPAGAGEVRELEISAAGVGPGQLLSIVSSGLTSRRGHAVAGGG